MLLFSSICFGIELCHSPKVASVATMHVYVSVAQRYGFNFRIQMRSVTCFIGRNVMAEINANHRLVELAFSARLSFGYSKSFELLLPFPLQNLLSLPWFAQLK